MTTDKAACYPPALRNVLPAVEHRTSKYLNNGLERDHQHLKQRLYAMRGFKQAASADIVTRGHALIQNLRTGFSTLTVTVPRPVALDDRMVAADAGDLAHAAGPEHTLGPKYMPLRSNCPHGRNRTVRIEP